jgi:hypothetical protein
VRDTAIHYPEGLRLRAPRGLKAAIDMAAAANNTTPSEWSRRALLQGLQADGLHLRDGQIAVTRSEKQNGSDFNRSSTPKHKTFHADRNSDR